MDRVLINYLRSGSAWILIGSGPSIEMGYPSWRQLALFAVESVITGRPGKNIDQINDAMKVKNYPLVFKLAKEILGGQYLISYLHQKLIPSRSGRIYELIVRWPVPVFLTTNYDDEIQKHLAGIGEAYSEYSNGEDHFSYLLPELDRAIYKLHGDLRSEEGLLLDSDQYQAIRVSENWEYWRTKLTSIFQLKKMIVIGHSLNDPNIIHVLEAAKKGSGVLQPICWIAPDIKPETSREFLEKYKIRVASYNNEDGEHRNLYRLIENISEFIPPRTKVLMSRNIARMSRSLGPNGAAPAFFVFNKLMIQEDFEEKRVDVIIAALLALIPKLALMGEFTLKAALEMIGWPKNHLMEPDLSQRVTDKAIQQGIIVRFRNDILKIGANSESLAKENLRNFESMQERFKRALGFRIRRNYSAISEVDANMIANDIESSLAGYFREGGLTLVSILFSGTRGKGELPISIIKFISEASARYDDMFKRQVFCTTSVEIFVHGGEPERAYLGRIAQGYFGFHSLGVFGGVAIERLRHAKETVWLIDSDAQIPALALGCSTNSVFKACFSKLKTAGIRLFTTRKIFEEIWEHLWFAHKLVEDHGPRSSLIISGATGQPPYRRTNLFLEGFINWQSAGNPCDWNKYLFEISGNRYPNQRDIGMALQNLGIEVVPFDGWPGFSTSDYITLEEFTNKIADKYESSISRDLDPMSDPHKKARPEGEALTIIYKERLGDYYMLSKEVRRAWFISHTSILNLIVDAKITWQPESFLNFMFTLALGTDEETASRAFDTICVGVAKTGLSLLDDDRAAEICGGTIDQEELNIDELRQMYDETISDKYGEPLEDVLKKISPANQQLATIQLLNEILESQKEKIEVAKKREIEVAQRAIKAEKELKELDKYRKKIEEMREKGRRKSKKQKARAASKRKK